jgi:pyrimidine operon attenuation protein/uracil phosphoribosyltransferase
MRYLITIFAETCYMLERICLMDADQAERCLNRLAFEIYERNIDSTNLVLVGIERRGVELAQLVSKKIEKISPLKPEVITLIINKQNPTEAQFKTDFNPKNKTVVLIDDVSNSGKTLTYALRLFLTSDVQAIQVGVLIERQHKRFPISSNYIGLQIATTIQNHISVDIRNGKVQGAYIE